MVQLTQLWSLSHELEKYIRTYTSLSLAYYDTTTPLHHIDLFGFM